MYKKYELAVHKKERPQDQLERFLCNSPVFDPDFEPEFADSTSLFTYRGLDDMRVFKDEGVFPKAKGTYHMYHRLNGKLVAVGDLDLLNNYVNSAYFIYDPDYKFLNLGVMGALRELEYLRLVRSLDNNKY